MQAEEIRTEYINRPAFPEKNEETLRTSSHEETRLSQDHSGDEKTAKRPERNAIKIRDGNFFWTAQPEKKKATPQKQLVHLKDINLSIKKGKFVAVIGE